LQPDTVLALRELIGDVNREVTHYKAFKSVPAQDQTNVRNDMYVASEALRLMEKSGKSGLHPRRSAALANYKSKLDKATRFIPSWVKVAVALALGLGTMVGWKRVVVTVGEKIGKDHLTYAQGAAAGLVAMGTIFAADTYGLPVSTPTFSAPAWPAPWPPTAAACASPPFATSPPAGSSPCPPPRCSPACSSGSSAPSPD
jgi:PiT family inorganic phosphate transporter